MRVTRVVMLLISVALPLGAGCRASADLTIMQPFAPPAQRVLELRHGARQFELRGDDRMVALLAFPLPGARDGPDDFVVYLDVPRADGTWRVGTAGSDARGFLIQATGALRGKTMLARGTIILKSPLLGGRSRTIQLDVETADGAFVRGKLTARPDSIAVREFETRRSGDVAALWGDAAAGLAADELGRRSMPGQPLSGTAPDGGASNSARP
ncbi:MAG: hypothetical protein CHACPFDD_02941 [Phycisphaerae bacterium]|nr:hypothetical protein [Phycisphaerae bacterium]